MPGIMISTECLSETAVCNGGRFSMDEDIVNDTGSGLDQVICYIRLELSVEPLG